MDSLKRLLPMLKPYRMQLVLAFVALTLVVVTDLLIPMQIQRVIDDGIAIGDNTVVISSTLLMIGLALLSMVMTFVNIVYATRVSESLAADLRDRAYRQVQRFSFANLDTLQTGELLVRLTSDVNLVKNALSMIMRMVFRAPLMLVGSLIILVITSPTLSLLLVVLLPLTVWLVLWYSRKTEPLYKKVQSMLDRLNTVLQENIAGVRVVKAFVRADHEIERFDKANTDYAERSIEVNLLVALLLPSMLILLNLGTTAIVWFGGTLSVNGALTTGEIVAFVNYLAMTIFPVMMLGMVLPQIYASEASAERILEIVDTESDVKDGADARLLARDGIKGRVVFDNVSFDYDGGIAQDAVLCNVSFTAEAGETVAILGATGSGKTSLISLIPRFYDAVEGRITIDDVDVRDVTQNSLRTNIGFALQEALLFSGTIKENIRYGRPDATDEEVIAAAKAAQAHDFIMEKPEGYDARVEQRGRNFSGGQKQRLSIARALCVRPPILVLDDSTSAVDVETETRIQDALDELMHERTTFVVAQRISTVLTADKIIVLDQGQVADIGTHTELLTRSLIYQEIYESQLGGGLVQRNGTGNGNSNASQLNGFQKEVIVS